MTVGTNTGIAPSAKRRLIEVLAKFELSSALESDTHPHAVCVEVDLRRTEQ
jgi:hypothetical protein